MGWDEAHDEALDELLRRAAWPEAQPGQVERLEGGWRGIVRRRNRRIGLSVAACLVLSVLCGAIAMSTWRGRQVAEVPQPLPEDREQVIANDNPKPMSEPSSHPPVVQIVREPNIYEQSIALLYRRQAIPSEKLVTRPEPTSELTAKVATDAPAGRAATSVETSDADQPPVDELFAAMSNPRVSIRLSAARTLGEMNHPEISRRLARMAMENVNRREALAGLLASSDDVAQRFLAYAQRDLTLVATMRALAAK